jgi:DnaJ-class molecular chaperone
MSLESINQSIFGQTLGPNFAVPTYYDVLNVDRTATRFAIRESYLRLKSLYTNGGDALYGVAAADDLSRHLQDLERAFEVLNDEARRAAYDRELDSNHNLTANDPLGDMSQTHAKDLDPPVAVPGVVQTSRSILKVNRIQASGSNGDDLQARMLGILDESDIGDGSTLVALREIARVSQAEIQERTKISLEYIRSIEANQFDQLPRVVYVKGFLRSYLRYLNVPNFDKIINSYVARLDAYQAGQK